MNYESFLIFERIVRLMSTLETSTARKQHATSRMWLLLKMINENTEATSTDVARRFVVKHPTATQLIDRAVSSGYVDRTPSKVDRRVYYLSLTKSGKAQLKSLNTFYNDRAHEALKHLDTKEHDELVRLLSKMMNGLEAELAAK